MSAPLVVAALSIAGFIVTLDRSPVAWPDSIIYASIARSLQLDHVGVPTVLRESAAAIDHLPFYGPVFFHLVAWLFALIGFADGSIRLVSLAGALLIALGGAGLVRALGGSLERQAWAAALLLLSPELGRGATDGRMDTIAVGFEMLALAVFTAGLRRSRYPWLHGGATGGLLAAAALTTPRAYPFVAAFFAGSAALIWMAREPRAAPQIASAAIAVLLAVGSWTISSHGNPVGWLAYIWSIGTHENVDVALLASSRDWSFTPWAAITPLAAITALVAARVRRARAANAGDVRAIERFGWLVAGMNLALCLALFNFTFFFGVYLFIPMLAVALASPTITHTRTVARLMTALLVADVAVRTGRYVRLAAVWSGTDPEPIERFIEAHVPPGSDVVGEESFYFFAVERAGSHYLFTTRSSADWTRSVPESDPSRIARTPQANGRPGRFLVWPADEARYPVPASLACARGEAVAEIDPLSGRQPSFGGVRVDPGPLVVYPKTVLYHLLPNRPGTMTRCPGSN